MSQMALQSLIGAALIDREFCEKLLDGRRPSLLAQFDLTGEEREAVLSIEADSIQKFAEQLYERLKDRKGFTSPLPTSDVSTRPLPDGLSGFEQFLPREMAHEYPTKTFSGVEVFLVESLAHGLLGACGVEKPPVPVRKMIRHSLPIFERLNLLELRLGLYDVAYRSLPNGSRVIVVDLCRPPTVQRAGMARELYSAFCRSPRAAELHWPDRGQPNASSDFFARCLMMPAVWVQQSHAETAPLEDLASHFGVPVRMAVQRLNELKRSNANTRSVLESD
jgi:hypothetical protein